MILKLRLFFFVLLFSQTALSAVKGNIDRTWTDAGYVYVNGWACQETLNQSINVHLYIGGQAGNGGEMVANISANRGNEAAVNTVCRTSGSNHRFLFKIPKQRMLSLRNKAIYVYGIRANTNASNAMLSKSGQLNVANFPNQSVIGYAGAVVDQPDQDRIVFRGWTCQPNVSSELRVHLYAGGAAAFPPRDHGQLRPCGQYRGGRDGAQADDQRRDGRLFLGRARLADLSRGFPGMVLP